MDLYTPDPEESGVVPRGPAEVHSAQAGASDAAAAGRPIPPVRPQSPEASAPAGPEGLALTVVQTVTAPTVTARGQDRKPSPSKPSSSRDGNRKPGKEDRRGKKGDKDRGEDDKDVIVRRQLAALERTILKIPSLTLQTANQKPPIPKKWIRAQVGAPTAGDADRVVVKLMRWNSSASR